MEQALAGQVLCPGPSPLHVAPAVQASATCALERPSNKKTKVLVSKAPSGAASPPCYYDRPSAKRPPLQRLPGRACFSRLDYVANTISAVVSLRRRSLSSLLSLAAVAVAVAATPLAVRSAHLDSTVNSILLS
ncbi:hypothetical protein BHE74_00037764 [Ensete ventricosum]|nr:hypothetical protein BHE74_00037764 [Ensete ventricosum]